MSKWTPHFILLINDLISNLYRHFEFPVPQVFDVLPKWLPVLICFWFCYLLVENHHVWGQSNIGQSLIGIKVWSSACSCTPDLFCKREKVNVNRSSREFGLGFSVSLFRKSIYHWLTSLVWVPYFEILACLKEGGCVWIGIDLGLRDLPSFFIGQMELNDVGTLECFGHCGNGKIWWRCRSLIGCIPSSWLFGGTNLARSVCLTCELRVKNISI